MRRHDTAIDRRQFLRQSAALGLGTLFAPALAPRAWAASRDRIVIYQGVSLDSLHPYGYSGGGITGIWRHVIEPLIQMDYDRNEYVGVLAQSWEFQGRKWTFHLRKGVRFHNGAPFTSKDVAFSIDKLQNDKRSLQGAYVQGVEVETPDDYTVVLTTKTSQCAVALQAGDSVYSLEGVRRRSRQRHGRHRSIQIRQLAARRQLGAAAQ